MTINPIDLALGILIGASAPLEPSLAEALR
jgi:hypothetical protein